MNRLRRASVNAIILGTNRKRMIRRRKKISSAIARPLYVFSFLCAGKFPKFRRRRTGEHGKAFTGLHLSIFLLKNGQVMTQKSVIGSGGPMEEE